MKRWARHYRGCVWMSHQTAARIGGDFGDFYQVAPAARFPTITAVCDAVAQAEAQHGRVTWMDHRHDRSIFRIEVPPSFKAGDALSHLWNRIRDAWEGWTLEVWFLLICDSPIH